MDYSNRRQARTYQYTAANLAEIDRLSKELNVWPSDLVAVIMQRGLAEIAAGRWHLGRRAKTFEPVFNDQPRSSGFK